MPWLATLALALFQVIPRPCSAEEFRLLDGSHLISVGLRAGFAWSSPIGKETPQPFQQYDVAAMFRLPWERYSESGWGIGTRFLASAGALKAAGDTGFISTLVPGIALGREDGKLNLVLGGGFAVLSDYRFGTQDLGGPFQLTVLMGLNAVVYRDIGIGYWFQHISDGTIYGGGSRGFDLHMFELTYHY